jgi:hypothetical protein
MMGGAKGIGMAALLAKRPRIWIISLCSLYHMLDMRVSGHHFSPFAQSISNTLNFNLRFAHF